MLPRCLGRLPRVFTIQSRELPAYATRCTYLHRPIFVPADLCFVIAGNMPVDITTIKEGDGSNFPKTGNQVECHYILTLENGKKVRMNHFLIFAFPFYSQYRVIFSLRRRKPIES